MAPRATHPTGGVGEGPAAVAVLADEVCSALLVVLDRLTPEQRVAFVLRDVFGEPFDRVADVGDRTPAAARRLASRARRRVRDAGRGEVDPEVDDHRRWEVTDAFVSAAHDGDLDGLVRLFHPDVELVADGGGEARAPRNVVLGPDPVGRFAIGVPGDVARDRLVPVLVGDDPGSSQRSTAARRWVSWRCATAS